MSLEVRGSHNRNSNTIKKKIDDKDGDATKHIAIKVHVNLERELIYFSMCFLALSA